MKKVFYKLPQNILECFSPRNLKWHLLAIISTVIIVYSGFDWHYLIITKSANLNNILFPAVFIGFFIPVLLPVCLFVIGKVFKNAKIVITAFALGQAAFVGWLISSFYKSLTGRAPPNLNNLTLDISHGFHFGLFNQGIFWGWPSSHTTIAFAMAFTLIYLYQENNLKNKIIKYSSLIYALYIGLGVSVSIHWFSEFFAGAILGSLIGSVIAKSFKEIL